MNRRTGDKNEFRYVNMKKLTPCILLFLCFSSFLFSQEANQQPIVIENRHMVAEMEGNELHITDALLLNIDSPEVFASISFSLPAGYRDFEIRNGLDPDSLLLEKERVVDIRHLTKGAHPIAFKYILPVQRNTATLTFRVYYDTEVFYFLVKNLELRVTSDVLVSEGLIDMGDHAYHALSAVALQSTEGFSITISGLGKQTRRKNVLIFASIVVVILIIVSAFLLRKGRHEGTPAPEQDELLMERKKALISIIALLDEAREKGEIGETVHRELRNEFKERLQRIIERIEGPHAKNAQG
jgi:hypothetical protein